MRTRLAAIPGMHSVTATWLGLAVAALIFVYHLVTKADKFLTAIANLKNRLTLSKVGQATKPTTAVLPKSAKRELTTKNSQDHSAHLDAANRRRFRKTHRFISKANYRFVYRLQSLEAQKRNWRSPHNIPITEAQQQIATEHHVFIAAKMAAFDLNTPAFRSAGDTIALCRRLEDFAKAGDIGSARRYLEAITDNKDTA